MQAAATWRARLHAGEASAEDWQAFTEWLERSPEHAQAYDLVCEGEGLLLDALEVSPVRESASSVRPSWAMAASLLVIVGAGVLMVRPLVSPAPPQVVMSTARAQVQTFEIARDVAVTLNGGTELVQSAGGSPELTLLDGEILVSVGAQHEGGVSVSVGPLTVIDRGTVFNVSSGLRFHRIAVGQGAVDVVFANRVVSVSAGSEAVYRVSDGSIDIESLDPAAVGSWRSGRLEYTSADVDRVLQDASRALGAELSRGTCAPPGRFVGSIQLGEDLRSNVELVSELLGCSPRRRANGWVLDK